MSSQPPPSASPPAGYVEQLTIETPEQTPVEFPIAGVGSRFLAFAFDTLIQPVVSVAVAIAVSLTIAWEGISDSSRTNIWMLSLLFIFVFIVYFGYFALFEAIWNGQTPGKRLTRIRVIKESGRPISPVESLARNLMRLVDQLPAFYGVGIMTVLLSQRSERLGDFVAGTIVIHERSLQDIRPLWQAAASAPARDVQPGSHNISPEDLALIETFLNRRESLPPDVRFRMANQIADRISARLAFPVESSLTGEKLLEALAEDRRSSAGYL